MAEDGRPDANRKKVIVAVHGIGDQAEFATIQQTAAQYCLYHESPFAVPLGNFHNGRATYRLPEADFPEALHEFFFAEVYWASIPREVVKEGYKLEDAQAWAKTIVGRVRRRAEEAGEQYGAREYNLLEEVLREMGETLSVLGRVFYLSGKMGLFSFDLDKVVKDYLDDVQLVAEFKEQSGMVIRRFSEQLDTIYQEVTKLGVQPEIYLVTHSEGTVVALLGLLSAICGKDPVHGAVRPPWLDAVRGWMTIGSPIDKHLVLWPELFEDLKTPVHQPTGQTAKQTLIEWRNYYDLGDPVGFKLSKAREVFNTDPNDPNASRSPWHWFNFPETHDHGFTRSLFPGKAHTDYWDDPAVFGHFMQHVVYRDAPSPPKCADHTHDNPPGDRWLHKLGSWILPYLATAGLLGFAVYTLYKAVQAYLTPEGKVAEETTGQVFRNVGGITALLAGLTVTARIPRLTREWPWRILGILLFFLGAFGFWRLTEDNERRHLGRVFIRLLGGVDGLTDTQRATWGFLGLAVLVAALATGVARRYPRLGVKPLLYFGGAGVFTVVAEHVINAENVSYAIWPVVLAGALFLYLWWLAALFFDLVFVWHRYIQASVAQDRLNALAAVRKT
jgi:hypothetical protein